MKPLSNPYPRDPLDLADKELDAIVAKVINHGPIMCRYACEVALRRHRQHIADQLRESFPEAAKFLERIQPKGEDHGERTARLPNPGA